MRACGACVRACVRSCYVCARVPACVLLRACVRAFAVRACVCACDACAVCVRARVRACARGCVVEISVSIVHACVPTSP